MFSKRRQVELLKKLKGGVNYDPTTKTVTRDLAMSEKDLKDLLEMLKGQRKRIVDNIDRPLVVDRESEKLIQTCEAAGLKEMPERNGVIAELLRKGSLADDTIKKTYYDPRRGEWVNCVNEQSQQAIMRFLENKDVAQGAMTQIDSEIDTLMQKIEMLEENLDLVKPFVTGHPQLGKMGAPLRLFKNGNERTVKGANGEPHSINSCKASTSRASCEAKRDSLYGEAGESCYWMPNFNHLTEQALAWEQETGKTGTWQKLQKEVCVPAKEFPFPMRKVTKSDMEALRSGIAWKKDPNRAMITKEGQGMGKRFAPNMRNPMDRTAQYGLTTTQKRTQPTFGDRFRGFLGLSGGEDEKKEDEKTAIDADLERVAKHYNVNATASQYNAISGKPLMMPYFYEKEENLARAEPKPVEMKKVIDYNEEATRLQTMFRSKRRNLPKRIEAKYEAEIAKQKAIRDDARLRLQNEFNAQPTENEVEDLAMQHPEARSRHAILQRLIYDVAVKGEWTEAEVFELIREDLRRGGGHVIIVSTEQGQCNKAYEGIASELDEKMAGKVLKNIRAQDKIKGTVYGKRAGNASLGEFFGVENTDEYKQVQKEKIQAAIKYMQENPDKVPLAQRMELLRRIDATKFEKFKSELITQKTKAGQNAKAAFTEAMRLSGLDVVWSTTIGTARLAGQAVDAVTDPIFRLGEDVIDAYVSGIYDIASGIGSGLKNFFTGEFAGVGEEYHVAGERIDAPPADSPALSNVITVLRGGGILPHDSYGELNQPRNPKRDADTSDKWGLTQILRSSLNNKMIGKDGEDKKESEAAQNTCLFRITESAAILMKANLPFYMPMIHNFYTAQQKSIEDINNRTGAEMMDTSLVDPTETDRAAALDMAMLNETDAQKFVREMIFDVKAPGGSLSGSSVDVMNLFSAFDAQQGAGLTVNYQKLSSEQKKELCQNKFAMSKAIRGPNMRQRTVVDGLTATYQKLPVPETGLPWPAWSEQSVLDKLASRTARGEAGKGGRSLIARMSKYADEVMRDQTKKDVYLKARRAIKGPKKWQDLYDNAVKHGIIGPGTGNAYGFRDNDEAEKWAEKMDQIDIVRIMMTTGSLGDSTGTSLSNDSLHKAVFQAYVRGCEPKE